MAQLRTLADRQSPERDMIPRALLRAMLALALSAVAIVAFSVLTDRPQPPRPHKRKIDGAAEARLVTLACSTPPDGRENWTLQLLADSMVKLKYVDGAVSDETVRRVLKKTRSSRG